MLFCNEKNTIFEHIDSAFMQSFTDFKTESDYLHAFLTADGAQVFSFQSRRWVVKHVIK